MDDAWAKEQEKERAEAEKEASKTAGATMAAASMGTPTALRLGTKLPVAGCAKAGVNNDKDGGKTQKKRKTPEKTAKNKTTHRERDKIQHTRPSRQRQRHRMRIRIGINIR